MTFSEIKSNKLLNTFMKKFVNQCESVDVQNVLHMYELCEALISIPATEVSRTSVLSAELVRTYLHPTGPKQVAMPSERSAQLFSELPQPSEHAIREIQDYVIPTLDQAAANFSLGFNTLLKEYKLDI
uniref:Uncharacterized protein n=1 Tax=Ciona savignyi TaxID=51511 RepID=H2ZBQ9_CIOSA